MLRAWFRKGNFVPQCLWEAVSRLRSFATCFVLKIMRTLQAVWNSGLKILSRGSFKPLRFPAWFLHSPNLRLLFPSAFSSLLGHVVSPVRNLFIFGLLPEGQSFDQFFNFILWILGTVIYATCLIPVWAEVNQKSWYMTMIQKTTLIANMSH